MNTIRYRSQFGVYHGFQVNEGRKYLQLMLLQHPVRVIKVDKREGRYIKDIDLNPRKLTNALRRMARSDYGNLRNVPKNVRQVLKF